MNHGWARMNTDKIQSENHPCLSVNVRVIYLNKIISVFPNENKEIRIKYRRDPRSAVT